jgi:hypothetical protein
MLVLSVLSLTAARLIERSRLGYGFATIRDDELAAEATGVPTLRLKLIATVMSGGLMGMAGAPLPYYLGYIEPAATFGLPYAVNSIAMPMIGGTDQLGRPADRRHSAGLAAADRHGDDFLCRQVCCWSACCSSSSSSSAQGIIGLVLDWRRAREKP